MSLPTLVGIAMDIASVVVTTTNDVHVILRDLIESYAQQRQFRYLIDVSA